MPRIVSLMRSTLSEASRASVRMSFDDGKTTPGVARAGGFDGAAHREHAGLNCHQRNRIHILFDFPADRFQRDDRFQTASRLL